MTSRRTACWRRWPGPGAPRCGAWHEFSQPDGSPRPSRERILSGFTRAVVLSSLGLAFLGLTFLYDKDWAVPASIVFALGIGYFLATLISYKLSAKVRAGELEPSSDISNS